MRVLVVNCGSSSLKARLFEMGAGRGLPRERFRTLVERLGGDSRLSVWRESAPGSGSAAAEVRDHAEAFRLVAAELPGSVDAVGHRVVHGGQQFTKPVVLTPQVIAGLAQVSSLAPLHNPPALAGIRAAGEVLGASVPAVAVFDTAFYSDLPAHASQYGIPRDLALKHGIQRYGFHGIAHQYALRRYCHLTGAHEHEATVVSLHLGNGCSATAIKDGRAVDTSMGFTPLEGLVMGTRSGDLDPAIVTYLCREEGMEPGEVERLLNERSGLLGVSGVSGDVRDLLAAAGQGHERAALALDLFCYRAKKYLGGYLAALGGAQAVLFGGGIGEHAPWVRERICAGMEWCGLELDPDRNALTVGTEGPISVDGVAMAAHVITSDEESLIAQETVRCLS